MRAASAAATHRDAPTAVLMVASARTQLDLMYERYQAPALANERAALRAADLASIQNDLRDGDAGATLRLALWPGKAAADPDASAAGRQVAVRSRQPLQQSR